MLRDFTKEEFDIIIQAGQSNSSGCGLGKATEPFVPQNDILYLNEDFTISAAGEQVSGNDIIGNFSLSFSREDIKNGSLDSGRKLLILRTAVCGTGFSDKRWGTGDDLFIRMTEMTRTALALNPKNRLIALLWHQGETDALRNASYDTHYANLSTLVNTVRETFNSKDLPFIAGDFVNEWKTQNIKICEPVIKAIKDVCGRICEAEFVETSELLSNNQMTGNGDIIHFCRESLNCLGMKYYKAFSGIK